MSLADQFSISFKKKAPASGEASTQEFVENDSAMSLGGESRAPEESIAMTSTMEEPESLEPQELAAEDLITVPVLGTRSAAQHLRLLSIVLALSLLVLGAMVLWTVSQTDKSAGQVAATGQALMQSQRLAKSVSQALVGTPSAFPDVKDSATALTSNVMGLKAGGSGVDALGPAYEADMGKIVPLVEKAKKNADVVVAQQKALTDVGASLRAVSRQSADLLEVAETISSLKLQHNAPAAEQSAVSQLVMLTQRIGKSANEFLTLEGVSPEAVFLLGKDLNSFKELAQGLLDGNADLRIAPARRADA